MTKVGTSIFSQFALPGTRRKSWLRAGGIFHDAIMDNFDAILFAGNVCFGVPVWHMPLLAKLLETAQPADLGPGPRSGVVSEKQLNASLDAGFEQANLSPENQQLVRGLILLWHDHLDAAHTLAQSIDNADGAYVHALMHRREPDYSNAAYWFRRVGQHRTFPELTRRAGDLLKKSGKSELEATLRGIWDPFAFVQACEQAASGSLSEEDVKCLRDIQRAEFEVLLEALL